MDEALPDLTTDIDSLGTAELLDLQQHLSRARLAINTKQREVQDLLDLRAEEMATRRAEDAALLGQVTEVAPPQDLFG